MAVPHDNNVSTYYYHVQYCADNGQKFTEFRTNTCFCRAVRRFRYWYEMYRTDDRCAKNNGGPARRRDRMCVCVCGGGSILVYYVQSRRPVRSGPSRVCVICFKFENDDAPSRPENDSAKRGSRRAVPKRSRSLRRDWWACTVQHAAAVCSVLGAVRFFFSFHRHVVETTRRELRRVLNAYTRGRVFARRQKNRPNNIVIVIVVEPFCPCSPWNGPTAQSETIINDFSLWKFALVDFRTNWNRDRARRDQDRHLAVEIEPSFVSRERWRHARKTKRNMIMIVESIEFARRSDRRDIDDLGFSSGYFI